MHIDELTAQEIQAEIVRISDGLPVLQVFGTRSQKNKIEKYKKALWARLKEIDPIPQISEDDLLAELGIAA